MEQIALVPLLLQSRRVLALMLALSQVAFDFDFLAEPLCRSVQLVLLASMRLVSFSPPADCV